MFFLLFFFLCFIWYSVKGVQYFDGKDKYCRFIRPDMLEVGNFPVIDELEDLSNDDDDEL